jgi:hypothetical protein
MTTIGLVSDTHLPRFGRSLPRALEDGLRAANVSRIFHLGDMTDDIAIPLFESIAPLDGVAGNNDPESIWQRFGRRKILTVDGVRIGLVHGDMGRGNAHDNAIAAFANEPVDVVLYGHSHRPKVDHFAKGRLIVNPGSPTDKRAQPLFSFGILTIADGVPAVELKYFPAR